VGLREVVSIQVFIKGGVLQKTDLLLTLEARRITYLLQAFLQRGTHDRHSIVGEI
jgi:hypothetical protein